MLVGPTRRRTTERTHAGAGSRRHPAQGARPQQSKAVVVHGRVGAGIKGVQPPLCVTRVRGFSAAAHAEDQQIAGVFNMFVGDQDLAPSDRHDTP